MIDHLISVPSAAAMAALLAPLGLASVAEDSAISWASNIILNVGGPNDQSIRVILADAVWDKSDPDPRNWTVATPEILATGFSVIVSLPSLDPRITGLAGNACRLAANPAYIEYIAPDMDPKVVATMRVEPLPLGRPIDSVKAAALRGVAAGKIPPEAVAADAKAIRD